MATAKRLLMQYIVVKIYDRNFAELSLRTIEGDGMRRAEALRTNRSRLMSGSGIACSPSYTVVNFADNSAR